MARIRRTVLRAAAMITIVGAAVSYAHDEDDQKLIDQLPAFVGPMITGADNMNKIAAGGFPSENMIMHSWIPLGEMPGNQSKGNDVWGYVSDSGREYAIMGVGKGYVFIEVTDPDDPQIIDYVSGPDSTWHDFKVIGDYGYGVSEGGAGIQVVDLSDIDSGSVDHVGNVTSQGHNSTHNIVANTDSGFLYLVGANVGNGGLVAVSTADPENPTIVGGWTQSYVHDAQVVTYTEGPYAGREIAFCCNGSNGMAIVDCTDKDNMFTLGSDLYPGTGYGHQGWLSEDKTLFYLNDEFDEGFGIVPSTTTHVFDVTDLSNPHRVSTFTNGSSAIDHNLYVKGDLIFESNYKNGLRVYDASDDPENPTEVAYFDTHPESDSADYNGTWSNYPFLPSGTILVSDRERGLFVLSLDGVCPADFNGDGVLDILDFVAFQNAFTSGDPAADFDGDGSLTILDFVAFQGAFQAGCE